MPITMQNIVDRARVPLNDAAKTRHSDARLLQFANDAIYTLRNKRPDLFFGSFAALPEELVIGVNFPLAAEYAPPVQDYVTARAEANGAEADTEGRAMAFFKLFESVGVS